MGHEEGMMWGRQITTRHALLSMMNFSREVRFALMCSNFSLLIGVGDCLVLSVVLPFLLSLNGRFMEKDSIYG